MLKRVAFFILVMVMNVSLYAQFKKGDKMVGASIGTLFFNNGSTDLTSSIGTTNISDDKFGISFSPSIGWFVSDNVAVGVAPVISYTHEKQLGKSSNGSTFLKFDDNQYSFGIGGFGRYYFKGGSTTTRFFGQYNLSFAMGGSTHEGFQYETLGQYVDRFNQKSSGDFSANTGISLGLTKFVSPNTAIDFYVGYTYSYTKSNPTGTSLRDYSDPSVGDETRSLDYDSKFTGHNLVLGVGFQIFLGKNK